MRIGDAIRAALGEVEDYQRVVLRSVEPALVVGAVAPDLAHLLAELIENALTFSPPDQCVELRGRRLADGYTLGVIDTGLGRSPTSWPPPTGAWPGAESFTIAPSKYLGHYVAGNLATRHGIGVALRRTECPTGGHGVTATVRLPPGLLVAVPGDVPGEVPRRFPARGSRQFLGAG